MLIGSASQSSQRLASSVEVGDESNACASVEVVVTVLEAHCRRLPW